MKCQYCGSRKVVKCGLCYKKSEVVQKYRCNHCRRQFRISLSRFRHYKTPVNVVIYAVLRYFSHPTMRQVIEELKTKFGVKVTPTTLLRWIRSEKKIRANLTERQRVCPATWRQLDKLKSVTL